MRTNGNVRKVLMTDTPNWLEMYMNLSPQYQGKSEYQIYRYHDKKVDVITTEPNDAGEDFEIVNNGTEVKIVARKFSTYAVVYNENKVVSLTPTPAPTPTLEPVIEQAMEPNVPTITFTKQMGFNSKFKLLLRNTKGAKISDVSSNTKIASINKKGIIRTNKKEGSATVIINIVK